MESQQLATLPSDYFDSRLDELAKVIPNGDKETAAHMARMVLTAINKTPALLQTTAASRLGCLFDIMAIGLEPNTPDGYAYLIPYNGQCTLQIGVNGFCKLAYDSNQVMPGSIKGYVYRQGDKCDWSEGTGANCYVRYQKAAGRGRSEQPLLMALASLELRDGNKVVETMDADESDKILRLSKSPASKQWEDEFRKKSVIKRMLKRLKIGGMERVVKAVEIDNKYSQPTPLMLEKKPHVLTFEDIPTAQQAPRDAEQKPARAEVGSEASTGITQSKPSLASAGKGLESGDAPASSIPEQRDAKGDYLW